MRKREKKWWQYLLVIPVMLVIDVIALCIAGMADTASAGDGLGHPMPAFLFVAIIICGVLTVVLTIRALFLCIGAIFHIHKDGEDKNPVMENKKPAWRCFIPLMVEIPLALIIVIICGYLEINSFYNNPNHIGFAFPITTFVLAGGCLLVIGVTGVICAIAAAIRNKRNNKL